MNPEDPKFNMASSASSFSPSFGPEQHHHHKQANVTLPSIHQAHPELSSPSISASSSSRALHSLYPTATPPMSPAHVLLSPSSRPHGYGTGAAGDNSSLPHGQGFYQLPPPLQTFRPYEHHQHPLQTSPTLQPVSNNYPSSHHPSPAFGAQRSPHLHHQSSSGSNGSMPLASPGLRPISPYLTPQHQPISSPQPPSSPHQSPRYERILPKQLVPSHLVLPSAVSATSATSSSSSPTSQVSPVHPPRPYASSPYPSTSSSSSGASCAPGSRKRSSASSASSTSTQFKSPRNSIGAKSAPSSPVYMMLPPKSTPPIVGSSKSASISGPSSSSSPSSATLPSAASTVSDGTPKSVSSSPSSSSKRRSASLSNKSVEQEAREMMRKVSHSAIERRRRERINDKILQLKHLVPACIDEDHLHKLSILQSTIEYIQYLKSCVPEHVANVKFKRASNNDPNNKTTDMLDALTAAAASSGASSRIKASPFSLHKPLAFAPMITTGLNQPFKKARSDRTSGMTDRIPPGPLQFHGSHFNTDVAQSRESIRRASSSASTLSSALPPPPPVHPSSSSQALTHADGRAPVMEAGSHSVTSSSSDDDDAKDGLLMLSQLSAGGPYSSPPESKMATAQLDQSNRRTQRQPKGKIVKRPVKSHRHVGASKARQPSKVEELERPRETEHDTEKKDVEMGEDEQCTEEEAGDEDYLDAGNEYNEEEDEDEEEEAEAEETYDDDDDDDDDDDYIDELEKSSKPHATAVVPATKRLRRTGKHSHDRDKPRRSIDKMSVDQMLC
ncbi:hypothetical protein BGZ73_007148 [Actinomortierella ambigua]|nr:hypothetical protein BGZ73_007148 [Actinomortierella ambigua]